MTCWACWAAQTHGIDGHLTGRKMIMDPSWENFTSQELDSS